MKDKKILIIIITVILIISIFIFSVTLLPKLKHDYVIKKIQKIDLVDSTNISTITRKIKYDNRKSIFYNVSNNVKEVVNNGKIYIYEYDGISIGISINNLGSGKILKSKVKSLKVNDRIFYISPSKMYDTIGIFTNIRDDIYYGIIIRFEKEAFISNDILQNIKPFFYIYDK